MCILGDVGEARSVEELREGVLEVVGSEIFHSGPSRVGIKTFLGGFEILVMHTRGLFKGLFIIFLEYQIVFAVKLLGLATIHIKKPPWFCLYEF
eukprot:804048-Amorphochlora_amoeboformis.AAC.1